MHTVAFWHGLEYQNVGLSVTLKFTFVAVALAKLSEDLSGLQRQ